MFSILHRQTEFVKALQGFISECDRINLEKAGGSQVGSYGKLYLWDGGYHCQGSRQTETNAIIVKEVGKQKLTRSPCDVEHRDNPERGRQT